MVEVMRWSAIAACALGLVASVPETTHAERLRLKDWSTLGSERFGFLIAYPGNIFAPRENGDAVEGHVLVSRDGAARLVVAAFENDSQSTLDDYRQQLLAENYTGAKIDYAPVKDKWFVLSGTRGDTHFYERVSFTCGGKLINSWALLYPANARSTYDRVVEAIARTYTPGAGRAGECD